MAMAMLIVGVLFGLSLSVTVALFGILGMDGHFGDNLSAVADELRRRITGQPRQGSAQIPERRAETDARLRSLQEELRVTQRLMDQARVKHQMDAETIGKATDEIAALHGVVRARDERISILEVASSTEAARLGQLREELAERGAQLAQCNREIRDLQTELGVARSGAALMDKQ